MTFNSAIQSLRDGEATKRESWRGYVTTENHVLDDRGRVTAYDVVIVDASGNRSVYPFGTDTPETATQLSKDLLESFMRDDWIRGSRDEFEKARVGTGCF